MSALLFAVQPLVHLDCVVLCSVQDVANSVSTTQGDAVSSKQALSHVQQRIAANESMTSQMLGKFREFELELQVFKETNASQLQSNLVECRGLVTSTLASQESSITAIQAQHDRLQQCVDECVKSISACNASITTQCTAVEANVTSAFSAIKRQWRDNEVAHQRQVEALTRAVQAIADVLQVTPGGNKSFV